MQTYFEVLLNGVKATDEEYISSVLFELGAEGITQNLKFIQIAEDFNPEIIDEDEVNLVAYFSKAISTEDLSSLKDYCKAIDLKEEEQKDWLEEWKKHYKAFAIVEGYWVVPSWLESPVADAHTIRINPGLAFGTGTHPTTQLVAQLIYDLMAINGKTFTHSLDLGAGTGILSILMARLGVLRGVATEIDPMAREKCVENLELNQLAERFVVDDENYIFKVTEPYPIVVANIIDGVLLKLRDAILPSFSDTLIVSGILDERNPRFVKEFIEGGSLTVVKSLRAQEWWAYVLKKS